MDINKYKKKINKYKKKINMIGGFFGEQITAQNNFAMAAIAGINYSTEEIIINTISENINIQNLLTKNTIHIHNSFITFSNNLIIKINNVFKTDIEKLANEEDKFIKLINYIWDNLYTILKYITICTIYDIYYKNDDSKEKFNIKILLYNDSHFAFTSRYENFEKIYEDRIAPLTKNIDEVNWFKTTLKNNELNVLLNYFCLFDYNLPIYTKKDDPANENLFSVIKNVHSVKLGNTSEDNVMIDKKYNFTKEELNNLKKFYDIDKYTIPKGFTNSISNIYDLDIGKNQLFIPKNSEFYDHYYKNGLIVKGGPSGSILYFKQLYTLIENNNEINEKSFFLIFLIYMLIRGDHSLFEIMITIPLKKENGTYLGLFVNRDVSWNEFTSEMAWESFLYLIADIEVFKPIRDIITNKNMFVDKIKTI